jgi:large subunit ribosomal protein L13
MRTYFPKQGDIEPRWFVIDAEGQVLGRLSTTIANIISGKAKPTYTPFLDTGDHVIVINAEKIRSPVRRRRTRSTVTTRSIRAA